MDPGRRIRSGSLFCSTFHKRLHEDDEEVHAFGVDDVERFIPADVQIITFSDDRQQVS